MPQWRDLPFDSVSQNAKKLLRLPAPGTGEYHPHGSNPHHALTFNLDHSVGAEHWLSCMRFVATAVRHQLHALA
jgi:hypothetical protein